ncbi:polysaccharide deacetylase family protein [Scytonema sp. NUACC26]|uniref:polysaccharide deacetylase family protein n=1 Tax=Scytonema sp. NUACC26 TaxID=3140176 RepID=UPI0038B2A81C
MSTTPSRDLKPELKSKVLTTTVPAQFSGAIVYQAKFLKKDKYIALTFDDGPWLNSTTNVLKILHQNNIKGTFFTLGENIQKYPNLAMQIVVEGHTIGNHTWHHWYHFLNNQTAAYEIDRTANLIYQITGVTTTLFRPPGGILNNGPATYARKKNYTVVMWSDDSQDYRRPSINILVNRVLKQAKSGSIILMHDGGGNRSRTVAALPQIISRLKQQGYSFVTIPELLEIQSKEQNLQISKLH